MSANDRRAEAAEFYDMQPFSDDIPFYRSLLLPRATTLLELGCGTARVALALAEDVTSVWGIELSPAMLVIAAHKLAALPQATQRRVHLTRGDIANFDLKRTFDLIVAPFRVFQALDTDAEVEGLLRCIRRHLATTGSCVLTMFNPKSDSATLRETWVSDEETFDWERRQGDDRIVSTDRRARLDPDRLVLYPELVHRRYRGNELIQEVVMPIIMRCWYPDQITHLLEQHGFEILETWGGYAGEPFGEGSELIVRFR